MVTSLYLLDTRIILASHVWCLLLQQVRSLAMQSLDAFQQNREIGSLLKQCSTVAVVGLSPKESRPSHMVGRYLLDNGYTVYPVNPGQQEIFGLPCYPDLVSVEGIIDIVDIFRRSEDVLPIVEQALALPVLPRIIWMQQGISNEEAAGLARSHGVKVIMDRCIKIDHMNSL